MADFKIAAIFSDRMVLQRKKPIRVFGEGENGKQVLVSMLGKTATATVENEKWCATLPPFEAMDNVTLKVSCDGFEREFCDVAIGEVWLAGGQSNMELELQNSKDGREVLKNIKDVNVRFYYTQKKPVIDADFLESEKNTGWAKCSPDTAACWSAVGYYFGKLLSEKLGVTVGIVGCNWGGTTATNWVCEEVLSSDKQLNDYLIDFENAKGGKSDEELIEELAEYRVYCAEWNVKCGKCYAENPKIKWDEVLRICGDSRYPGPLGPTHEFRPNGLYETMLKRVAPYTLQGFIYYQGESDDHKPDYYQKLLTALIKNWRELWADNSMPFGIVQLTMFANETDPADWTHWCRIREAQAAVSETVKNTQLAVIIDVGEFNNIHPLDKETVGVRLANLMLEDVYNMPCNAKAATLDYSYTDENKLIVKLKNCNEITLKGEKSMVEIAGEDKVFYDADIKLCGNTIEFTSENVKTPCYARYAFHCYGIPCLFSENGLPVAPFRTSKLDDNKATNER